MPELWAAKDAVNRKFKELWAAKDGTNRKLKEAWARDSSGVNRKIFSGFGWTYSEGKYLSGADLGGITSSTMHGGTFEFLAENDWIIGNIYEQYDFSEPIDIPANGINFVNFSGDYGADQLLKYLSVYAYMADGTKQIWHTPGGDNGYWENDVMNMAHTGLKSIKAFIYYNGSYWVDATHVWFTLVLNTINHGTFTLTPNGQP